MNRFVRYFFLSLSLAAGTVMAVPGDRDVPVEVSADRNRGSLGADEIIYLGNVHIEQGTLTLTGDEVTIYRGDDGDVRRIEALGEQPACVSDQLEEDQPVTRLDGTKVIYDAEEGYIMAQGSGRLEQGRNLVTAHYIRYDLDTEEFVSDFRAPDGSTGDRVNMSLISDSERNNGETTQRSASC